MQTAYQENREIASLLVSSADTYLRLQNYLTDKEGFHVARREALSLSIMSAQLLTAALENMHRLRSEMEREYHPPMMALLVLGAIGSSCTLISAANNPEKLKDVQLLSARYLQAVLEMEDVSKWLHISLKNDAE